MRARSARRYRFLALVAVGLAACRTSHRLSAGAPDDAGPIHHVRADGAGSDAGTQSDAEQPVDNGGVPTADSPIAHENRMPGSDQFALSRPAHGAQLAGYAATTSASPGERVELFVSVDSEQPVRWELFRLGLPGPRRASDHVRSDRRAITWLGDGNAGLAPEHVVLPRGIVPLHGGYAVADSGNHRVLWFEPGAEP